MSSDTHPDDSDIPKSGLRRSSPKVNVENGQPPAKPGPGLHRTISRNNLHSSSTMDLKSMLGQPLAADSSGNTRTEQLLPPPSSGGLRKTKSQLNIGNMKDKGSAFGSNANLAKLAQTSLTSKPSGAASGSASSAGSGGLGLRRTGSKMSLSEALQNPPKTVNRSKSGAPYNLDDPSKPEGPRKPDLRTPDSKPVNQAKSKDFPQHESPAELENRASKSNSSISRPSGLYRSESMSSLPHTEVSEGTKAVESITGKVHLPQAAIQSTSGKLESPFKSASAKNEGSARTSSSPSPTGQAQDANFNSILNHGSTLHDDAAARPEAEDRVDYFTHKWDVSDIADSWRYVVSRRQDMANSARLENASWRMWAKAKNNLRTIDPAQVNWLKDYDVTWLYGPLYHDSVPMSPGLLSRNASLTSGDLPVDGSGAESIPPSKSSSSVHGIHGEVATVSPVSRFGSLYSPPVGTTASPRATIYEASRNSNYRPKSILKKKTLAQIMLAEAQELDQITQTRRPSARQAATNYLRHHNYRPSPQGHNRQIMATILNRQYQTHPRNEASAPSTPNVNDSGSDSPSMSFSGFHGSGSSSDISTLVPPPTSANAMKSPPPSDLSPEKSYAGSLANSRANSWTSSRASSRASSQIGFLTHHNSVHSFRESLGERRVHFNDRVEQCIALDPEDVSANTEKHNDPKVAMESLRRQQRLLGSKYYTKSYMSSDDDDDEDDDDDSDDGGGGLFLGLRRPSVLDTHSGAAHTIAALPATTLNYRNDDSDAESESEDDEVDSVSMPPSRRPGFNAQYKPHPVQTYQIVDPEVHPVAFQAKAESSIN